MRPTVGRIDVRDANGELLATNLWLTPPESCPSGCAVLRPCRDGRISWIVVHRPEGKVPMFAVFKHKHVRLGGENVVLTHVPMYPYRIGCLN